MSFKNVLRGERGGQNFAQICPLNFVLPSETLIPPPDRLFLGAKLLYRRLCLSVCLDTISFHNDSLSFLGKEPLPSHSLSRHAHNMFTTCLRHIHNMFKTCSWNVHHMFITCLWHVHDMFMSCLWHVHDMFMTCSWHVHDMFMTFSWHVHFY